MHAVVWQSHLARDCQTMQCASSVCAGDCPSLMVCMPGSSHACLKGATTWSAELGCGVQVREELKRRGADKKVEASVFREAQRNATHTLSEAPDVAVADAVDVALRDLDVHL